MSSLTVSRAKMATHLNSDRCDLHIDLHSVSDDWLFGCVVELSIKFLHFCFWLFQFLHKAEYHLFLLFEFGRVSKCYCILSFFHNAKRHEVHEGKEGWVGVCMAVDFGR